MNPDSQIQISSNGYDVIEKLGRGGFGTVFRARQQSTGQMVAVKMLSLEGIDEPERDRKIERFERETQLCADLHHPSIVRLIDKFRMDDHHLFAVFEHIQGETLRDLLLREGPLPAQKAGELMGQVLEGLACAHERGFVHRDLKPSNIMITPTETRTHVKILDFGIGTLVPDARKADYMSLTLSRETLGTPSYSAPEQLRGEPPTVKSDLYAWGLVFVECLIGQAVIQGETVAEIFHRQLSPEDVPLPPAILGHPLGDLLRRTLRKNQKDRPEIASQLYVEFQKINLAGLVGKLHPQEQANATILSSHAETTETVSPRPMLRVERRQITVLCLSLGLTPVNDLTEPDIETIDALQRNLLSLCTDIGVRYGGYSAGFLGDCTMLFFGYPQAGDSDARRAARTALEIAGQMRRNSILNERQGIRPAFRIGIHSGITTTSDGATPSGMTPNIAMKLQNLAPPGTVLVSDSAQQLLKRHIEFEPFESYPLDRTRPSPTFLLTGEREAEAFSFLQAGGVEIPVVGRDEELNTLRSLWEMAEAYQGNTVVLTGEPGIGKSRLTYEIRRHIADHGQPSIVCRCLPEHRNNALFHILEIIKSQLHLQHAPSPEEGVRRLENILKMCSCNIEWSLPIFCSWLSMPPPESFPNIPHSPERQKKILLDVLVELIINMTQNAPLLVIVEDLHWADQITLELIELLRTEITQNRIMMVLTARPEFSVPWERENVTIIKIKGISPKHAEVMIRELTGNREMHPGVPEAVYRRTDGVPLFIEELVSLMMDRQHLIEHNGMYHMHAHFDPASVPITLQDLLNEKLGRLGPAMETAQTAAAIGREFDYMLLVQISLRDEPSIQTDLDRMAAEGLVYRQRRIKGETYIFRHALIRDAAYNSMVQSVKSRIHGRIATILENDFPERVQTDPAGIARHFAQAGIFEKAIAYSTWAASTAMERSLNDETIFHANRVLKWIDHIDPEKRCEAELNINGILTQAMMGKFGWAAPEVKAGIDRSHVLLEDMEQNSYLFPALWALGTYHHVASNRNEVHAIIDRLIGISQQSDDSGLRVAADTLMGQANYIDGNYPQAAKLLTRALEKYDPDIHKHHGLIFGLDTKVWALSTMGNVQLFLGETQKAKEYGKQATEWANKINHIPSLGISLLYRGMICHFLNDKAGAASVCGELITESKKYGLPAYEGYGAVIHAWAVGDAETLLNILQMLRDMGCLLGLTQYDSLYADIEADKGFPEKAVECIDQCICLCRQIGEHYYEPELYRRRADYLLRIHPEDSDGVQTSLLKAVTLARRQGMYRTEIAAIRKLMTSFNDTGSLQSRIEKILSVCPELSAEPG